MVSLINTRQFVANKQIKIEFSVNGITLIIIHWKISINLLINSLRYFTVYITELLYMSIHMKIQEDTSVFKTFFYTFWQNKTI